MASASKIVNRSLLVNRSLPAAPNANPPLGFHYMTAYFRLAEILEQQGLGRREFARLAGISYPTVIDVCENRNANIKFSTLEKAAAALGLPVRELIKE
jgi:DNA-binding Xre family transcriptional regulator